MRFFIRAAYSLLAVSLCLALCNSPASGSGLPPATTQHHERASTTTPVPQTQASTTALTTPDSGLAPTAPAIHDVTTNIDDYPGSAVPTYEKLEITFQVETLATNPQLPYDASPPPGIEAGIGISVDALFSPDGWQTIYTQPAFHYQVFQDEIRRNREWFYPTGGFAWKVRFAPNQADTWQYRLVARDQGGISETAPQSFQVIPSGNHGFVRVSANDPRYFQFDDGTYLPALGYNMNFDHIDWNSPVLANQDHFQVMGQNGIQLVRIWLSQWGIFSSAWNPWNAIEPDKHGQYIPRTGASSAVSYGNSEVSMQIRWANDWYSTCMFTGFMKASPAVKNNTEYRVRVRYKAFDVEGPLVAGSPYGFVAKTGGWLWHDSDETQRCYYPGVGTIVAASYPGSWQSYADPQDPSWTILEGVYASGNRDYMENFYLALENVTNGAVYVDHVWIEEDLGSGNYGPNIVHKPWMAHHRYFEQRASYAFDKVVELAHQHGIYLRPVILEKNEWIQNAIDYDGDFNPAPGNVNFYGDYRQMTKVRWLQQAWWRYLQARWGYSTHIHSWELLNEGDPWNGRHHALADEFGAYMHQFSPNDHLVSTSTWHSFPRDAFWANPAYPDIDFADVHRYIPESDPGFGDAAQATYDVSMQYGARQPGGAGKPVIRGETGFVTGGSGPASNQLLQDVDGIWLHNFIWGGINPGGLIESYWYENVHIYDRNSDGTYEFDHRPHFGAYYNFIKDIPLNNSYYQAAQAEVGDGDLRAWGQKDLLNGRVHLWLQNRAHTWQNVVGGVPIPAITATVAITGFQPGEAYALEWWDPYESDPDLQIMSTETITGDVGGSLVFTVDGLTTDAAIHIQPLATSWCRMHDLDDSGSVDIVDIMLVASHLGCQSGDSCYDSGYDLDQDGEIGIADMHRVADNWHCL